MNFLCQLLNNSLEVLRNASGCETNEPNKWKLICHFVTRHNIIPGIDCQLSATSKTLFRLQKYHPTKHQFLSKSLNFHFNWQPFILTFLTEMNAKYRSQRKCKTQWNRFHNKALSTRHLARLTDIRYCENEKKNQIDVVFRMTDLKYTGAKWLCYFVFFFRCLVSVWCYYANGHHSNESPAI